MTISYRHRNQGKQDQLNLAVATKP